MSLADIVRKAATVSTLSIGLYLGDVLLARKAVVVVPILIVGEIECVIGTGIVMNPLLRDATVESRRT